ncbi:hypothetical protein ACFPES_29675 [Paenibacillus sp. GCM10023248]|uniref:hypothetical protein n=1 Tax=unclassified Paenibacillus TaxID=185978 RepID=UPI0023797BEA|nr:hypothetical protein [Paenibacillus sp. MAHUQ-63]MDD9271211.1 hypothetical protein [Paenibacillus sp. MAHUQ-63]
MNRKPTLWTLIATQIFYLLFILVWMFIAGMSVMMFDSPDAAGKATTWLIFAAILLYPAGVLTALIAGWLMFSRRRYRAALLWNCIPLIWILPLGGFFAYANLS